VFCAARRELGTTGGRHDMAASQFRRLAVRHRHSAPVNSRHVTATAGGATWQDGPIALVNDRRGVCRRAARRYGELPSARQDGYCLNRPPAARPDHCGCVRLPRIHAVRREAGRVPHGDRQQCDVSRHTVHVPVARPPVCPAGTTSTRASEAVRLVQHPSIRGGTTSSPHRPATPGSATSYRAVPDRADHR
jgi:hypothetical protein